MSGQPRFNWVKDTDSLRALADALQASPWHALDSESNSGFAYRERLCLLQVNAGGQLWLVDLLALPGGDQAIDALRPPLEDPGRRTYLHGGEFDVGCLKRDYDLALRGVWDSQQAAAFLGWEKTGYGVLVERLCGVHLPKAFAHYNWAKRPLEPGPLGYALNDVVYLPKACRQLEREVADADLEEEVAIANTVVEEATWNGGPSATDLWRIKGVGGLPSSGLPVLVALLAWRDEIGRARDMPPGRVLNQQVLLAISRREIHRLDDLRRVGLRGRAFSQWGVDLLRLIKAARRDPPAVPERPRRPRRDPEAEERGDRLKAWRREEAARREVTERVVLPAAALRHLQQHGAGDLESVPQLGPKRTRRYGDALRRLLA